jgi:hypothetical protein
MLSLTWHVSADDNRVMTAATSFMNSVEQEAKRRGVHSLFIHLKYRMRTGVKSYKPLRRGHQSKVEGGEQKVRSGMCFPERRTWEFELWP